MLEREKCGNNERHFLAVSKGYEMATVDIGDVAEWGITYGHYI